MKELASLLPVSYDDATKYKIDHAGRVSREVFQTIAGFFFALATLAFLGRISVRLVIRKRLWLDDYILLIGFGDLIASTALIYRFCHLIFVLNALKYDKTVIPTAADPENIVQTQAINYTLLVVIWIAICSVKPVLFGFIEVAYCECLCSHNNVVLVRSCTIHHYLGLLMDELLKHCTSETPFAKTLGLSIMGSFLDIITDIMIVTIPIWILRTVRISLKQKFAIGVFLCLSFVIIVITITRMAARRHDGFDDFTWDYLLMYLEACIAMLMASLAAFRNVFVEHRRRQQEDQLRLQEVVGQADFPQRPENLRGRIGRRARAKKDAELEASLTGHTSYLPRAK